MTAPVQMSNPRAGTGLDDDARSAPAFDWTSIAYFFLTVALCGPSMRAWTLEPFNIGDREFDLFLGQFGNRDLGRVWHTLGFLLLGALYVQLMKCSRTVPKWLLP